MRGRSLALSVALLLITGFAPLGSSAEAPPELASCGDDTADLAYVTWTREVAGETVVACVVSQHGNLVADGSTSGRVLVVMAHGFGHTAQGSWMGHATEVALAHDEVIVLVPNYRDNFGFPILGGAQDLIHFTKRAKATFDGIDSVVLHTVSMGSAIGGTAIHHAAQFGTPGEPLFDFWVSLEGAHNPIETYFEARALAPGIAFAKTAQEGIERDAGGSFEQVPGNYIYRAPVMNAQAITASGLRGAYFVHGVNDGLVPYDQTVEMVAVLQETGLPLEFTTVLRHDPSHTSGTTPTSHAGQPDHDPNEQFLGFAGHGTESDRGHIIIELGMARLHALLDGDLIEPGTELSLYDEATGLQKLV